MKKAYYELNLPKILKSFFFIFLPKAFLGKFSWSSFVILNVSPVKLYF